jgi:hypothetical protein
VNTQGTTDRWSSEWELKSKSTLAELRKFFEAKLQENGKWILKTPDWPGNSSQWNFKGDSGEAWNGTLNLSPLQGQKDTYKLSLQIQRT